MTIMIKLHSKMWREIITLPQQYVYVLTCIPYIPTNFNEESNQFVVLTTVNYPFSASLDVFYRKPKNT